MGSMYDKWSREALIKQIHWLSDENDKINKRYQKKLREFRKYKKEHPEVFLFSFNGRWLSGDGIVFANSKEEALQKANDKLESEGFKKVSEHSIYEPEKDVYIIDDGDC